MSRKIVFLFPFILIGLKATCQNAFGLKAGVNLAYQTYTSTKVSPHQTNQTKSLFGYQAGLFYKTKISNKLSFAPEANFSLVGANDQYFFVTPNGTSTQYYNDKIGYIEVPLLVQYNINMFYVSAGPAMSFKLFSKSMSGNTLYYNSFDLAGKLLTGYHVAKKWDVNLSYSYGLLDINQDPNKDAEIKNRYLNLSLLYSLK